jgi:riboflavin biosynthesis pyrimidine reductase
VTARFDAYCRRKEAAALSANIPGYTTAEQKTVPALVPIGSDWSRALFDGDFFRGAQVGRDDVPNTSLVFVQSRDHNTVAADPSVLGGGDTDLHLVYEGLSRIDADAVMAGASTARARELVFSVWHPELVALRLARGRRRHPAQVVLTDRGDLRFDDGLMFQEPELPVFIVTKSSIVAQLRSRLRTRPWIEVVDSGEPVSLIRGLRALHARGIGVLSCVGGARTATALLNERLVTDVYLTTSPIDAGKPDTPYYEGPPLPLDRVLLKHGQGVETGVTFEHFLVKSGQAGLHQNSQRPTPNPRT